MRIATILLLGSITFVRGSLATPVSPPADSISWWRGQAHVPDAYVGTDMVGSAEIRALCETSLPIGIGRFQPAPSLTKAFVIGRAKYNLFDGSYEMDLPSTDSCGIRMSSADVYVVGGSADSTRFDVTLRFRCGSSLDDSCVRITGGLIVSDGHGREVVQWSRPFPAEVTGTWMQVSIPWVAPVGDLVTVRTILIGETFEVVAPADEVDCDRRVFRSHVKASLAFEGYPRGASPVSTRGPVAGCRTPKWR